MALSSKLKPLLALCLAFSLSLLTACGFHLRDALDVDASKAQMDLRAEQAGPTLERALTRSLSDNNIKQTADAPYRLTINSSRFLRESVSLDRSARVDEYSLTLKVQYELRSLNSDKVKTETAVIERVYTYDAAAAAAKDEQESLLRREMYDAIATRIMRAYLIFDSKQ